MNDFLMKIHSILSMVDFCWLLRIHLVLSIQIFEAQSFFQLLQIFKVNVTVNKQEWKDIFWDFAHRLVIRTQIRLPE